MAISFHSQEQAAEDGVYHNGVPSRIEEPQELVDEIPEGTDAPPQHDETGDDGNSAGNKCVF